QLQGDSFSSQVIRRADLVSHSHSVAPNAPSELDNHYEFRARLFEYLHSSIDHSQSTAQVGRFAVEHCLHLLGKVVLKDWCDIDPFGLEDAFLYTVDHTDISTPGDDIDGLCSGFDGLEPRRYGLT